MNYTMKFEKIVPEGKALGYLDGRACFCAGPLPGETATVSLVKDKKSYAEAVLQEITEASPHRSQPAEDHYLACSPWQGVDYAYQLELKQQMLTETFARPELKLPVTEMVGALAQTGYRNKLEFSLMSDADKQLRLAFHNRGSLTDLTPLPQGCVLGHADMNAAALSLLERVNTLNISGYIESIAIRRSGKDGKMLAIIGLHQVAKREWAALLAPELSGVVVSRIRRGHQQEIIWQRGGTSLTETVGGLELAYPYDGFFQTNVPMFERALEHIIAAVPENSRVVDLYGGAGAIGLPLAKTAREVVGIEIHPEAVEQAGTNAWRAGVENYRAVASAAERLDPELLKDVDVVVVDPPRAGLHERVIGALLDAAPQRIVYLSCNPVTQARDMISLAGAYRAKGVTGFDFYPGTLQLESLVVLDRV